MPVSVSALESANRKTRCATGQGQIQNRIAQIKASMHAKLKYPFHLTKNTFGQERVHYQGLFNNATRITCGEGALAEK